VNKYIYLFLLLFYGNSLLAQSIDAKKLYQEISDLNRNYNYELSIVKLENIINDPKSTSYDKYNAYLLKAQTYKRVFNYPSTLDNLDLAYKEGMKTERKKEVETRIRIEKMFIDFDLLNFDKVPQHLAKIDKSSLPLIDGTTLSFYYNVLAVMDIREGKLKEAEKSLYEGIKVLEETDPQHLPGVYIKLLALAENLNDIEMARSAFDKGMHYAEEYKMDIYKIRLYFEYSHFFVAREDYKNAYFYQNLGSELSGKYNAPYQSGKMNMLENEMLKTRTDLELKNERNMLIFLSVLLTILLILILVLFKLFKVNKQKRALVESENDRIRAKLEKLSWELDQIDHSKVDLKKYDLSERQLEIIELIKQGKTNKEIGSALFISENTVKYHLKIIYNVLGIDNRISLKV
jgi:DNA-binding CsgD family transcriptional regulator